MLVGRVNVDVAADPSLDGIDDEDVCRERVVC